MILQFVLDIFTPKSKLLSVSISRMSIIVETLGYNSESWSDTLIKQFNNGINNTLTKRDLNNPYSVALLNKIFRPPFDLAAILGKTHFFSNTGSLLSFNYCIIIEYMLKTSQLTVFF